MYKNIKSEGARFMPEQYTQTHHFCSCDADPDMMMTLMHKLKASVSKMYPRTKMIGQFLGQRLQKLSYDSQTDAYTMLLPRW